MHSRQGGYTYLEVFSGGGHNGAPFHPDGAHVCLQRPQQALLVMDVPQHHPEEALGLARQLEGEEQAERPGLGCHQGAEEAGAPLLRLRPGVQVQVAVELWSEGMERSLNYFFVFYITKPLSID